MPSESVFRPAPGPQSAFMLSEARIVGYGGAMGGGKSRALCEKAIDIAVENPGCPILIARQEYTAIKQTTRRTFFEEVMPYDWLAACQTKASQGEDWVRFPNGSVIHFAGLEDPVRWYSAQLGVLMVDQVEECAEDTIVKLITRLRHPTSPTVDVSGRRVAGRVFLSFNPADPGHWLINWFIAGASPSKFGFRRDELFATDATRPLGTGEFLKALATDNPHLAPGYVEDTLSALPEHLRRRYLEGIWEFISGTCYFDTEALSDYQSRLERPLLVGKTTGNISKKDPDDKVRVQPAKSGPLVVWQPPVRDGQDKLGQPTVAHRYVISVDVSSGASHDYSAMQVIDVEEFAQVAEFQARLDPDQVAVEAFRLGKIYNDALIVPEITGGWGFTIVRELERLGYRRIYTKRVEDRVKKKWTDRLGWDTTAKSRAVMLDTLERVLREREFVLRGERTLSELGTFVRDEKGRPAAQPGRADDLVISLAIAVLMATTLPRQLRREKPEPYRGSGLNTGY